MRHLSAAACAIITLSVGLMLVAGGCSVDPMEELSQKKDSPRLEDRKQAVVQLANLNNARALKALVDVLQGDEQVCDLAGVALVKLGREASPTKKPNPVIEAVTPVAADPNVADPCRARAAWVLGEIGRREGIAPLIAARTKLADETAALQQRQTDSLKANDPQTAATYGKAFQRRTEVATTVTESLDKLGYTAKDRALEIAWNALQGRVETLPTPRSLMDRPPLVPAT